MVGGTRLQRNKNRNSSFRTFGLLGFRLVFKHLETFYKQLSAKTLMEETQPGSYD